MERVLLFTQIYPPQQGGAATFYSNLIQTRQNGMNFFIISEYVSDEKTIEHRDEISLYRVLPRVGLLPRIIQAPLEGLILFAVSLYLVIAREIDVIHSHASRGSIIGLAATSIVFRIPIIYDCRDTGFRPEVVRTGLTPVWFSCASNIDQLLVKNGVPDGRIVRLPVVNPQYVREYRSTKIPEEPTELVFIGSIVSRKGIFLLLSAFEIIHKECRDVQLTVIGTGPDKSEFEMQCQRKGIRNHISLTGSLDHAETLRRLADADILVLPSESEGVPRVILEGQDVGTPVVATAVGGIPDVITHEKNGMLASQTADSIAENVLQLIQDKELYRRVLNNGIKDANKKSWDSVWERLREGYRRASVSQSKKDNIRG